MDDEETPRQLAERTGRHYCVRCLAEVAADEYFDNDFCCNQCADDEMKRDEGGRMKDE